MTHQSMLHADEVFAPLDPDHAMERIGGGWETEVYCSDDRRYVVKLKHKLGGDTATALARVQRMRAAADDFATCIGPEHSIPNAYVLSRDSAGRVQTLVIQPFIGHAHPLCKVDLAALSPHEREHVAAQLETIVWRALDFYRNTGAMPDLYGLTSTGDDDRARLSKPHMLPWHIWNFLFGRNLLRSCNLLLTDAPERRVVLVDYDLVAWPPLIRMIYFAVRWLLCWRDHLLISRMRPKADEHSPSCDTTPTQSDVTAQHQTL